VKILRLLGVSLALWCAAGTAIASRAAAQATPADSAGVLYQAAMRLDEDGQRETAVALLRFLIRQYPGTPAAADAEKWLEGPVTARNDSGKGRGELMVWYTIYGAWLGVAVPAALGADEPEPYGVGLLAGAPLGFLLSRAYARATAITPGQARALDFGSQWGTWQGLGWQQALDLGGDTETQCAGPNNEPPCYTYEVEDDQAPWKAMVVGGISGAAAAALLTHGRRFPPGSASYSIHGGLWGTWFGIVGFELADVEDGDEALAWALVGGNLGLLAGALTAPSHITSGRVWLITAGGIAGMAAGFGLDLLLQPDDETAVILPPAIGSALGLFLASRWTGSFDRRASDAGGPPGALLGIHDGRFVMGMPAVTPVMLRRRDGTRHLGVHVPLFELSH
jgi:hypothetical protein